MHVTVLEGNLLRGRMSAADAGLNRSAARCLSPLQQKLLSRASLCLVVLQPRLSFMSPSRPRSELTRTLPSLSQFPSFQPPPSEALLHCHFLEGDFSERGGLQSRPHCLETTACHTHFVWGILKKSVCPLVVPREGQNLKKEEQPSQKPS